MCEKEGRNGFQIENEKVDASYLGTWVISICTQAHTAYEFFALVESI